MRISALEADELVAHLRATERDTEETRDMLRATIARFGLDRPAPGDGRRVFGRRRYTCPFFSEAGRCTIAPEAKPHGCLAFNARRPGVRDGEDCASDQELMREHALESEEEALDIPRAVLAALGSARSKLTLRAGL